MYKTKLLMLLVGALFAMPLAAQNSSDLYVIPVASHTSGQFGTTWMSDLAIQNTQSAPLTVQLIFIETGEGNPNNLFPVTTTNTTGAVTVPAGGSVLLKDVLNGYRGFGNIAGSLIVGGDKPFALTSRSYSMTPAGNTIGQTVPPAANFIDNTVGVTNNQTAIAYLPGLINNAQFRTNIGFVAGNGSSQPMSVQVTVRNAAGSAVGTRAFTIPGGAFTHVQFSISSVAPPTFDIAGAEVTITQGSGAVIPYASVIDNGSADAVFVLGQFPANAPFAGKTAVSSVFRDLFIRMTQ
jgi:hypothetical protein